MQVEIFSDVVCPWCYIGRARFTKALAQHVAEAADGAGGAGGEIAVRWRAFQLDPSVTTSGPTLERLAAKFGGPERVAEMVDHVSGVARDEGLAIDLPNARAGSTIDAHRVIALAAAERGADGQDEAVGRIFTAYFAEGADVSDHTTLARLGGEVGLDPDRVRSMLGSDDLVPEVAADLAAARQYGISAVPFFVLDGRYGISGAQPVDTLRQVLREVASGATAVG